MSNKGLARHRRRPRHGRRHRQGRSGRRPRRRRHWTQPPRRSAPPSARTTIWWLSSSTSPTRPALRPPSGPPSVGSDGSTCWSTTRVTSMPGSSRSSARKNSGADRDQLVRSGQCHPRRVAGDARASAPAWSSRSPRRPASSAVSFSPRTPPSKFGVEGWMESLHSRDRTVRDQDDARRDRLLPHRTADAGVDEVRRESIADYAERTAQTVAAWQSMDGQQGGDPAKLADALVRLTAQDEPPRRFPAGADAVTAFEDRAKLLLEQAEANRELSRRSGPRRHLIH